MGGRTKFAAASDNMFAVGRLVQTCHRGWEGRHRRAQETYNQGSVVIHAVRQQKHQQGTATQSLCDATAQCNALPDRHIKDTLHPLYGWLVNKVQLFSAAVWHSSHSIGTVYIQ